MFTTSAISYISPSPCVVALGCFDGVHRGHREVLLSARRLADKMGLHLCVFTFEQPPRSFFSPSAVPMITIKDKKLEIFEELGVDVSVCVPLSKEIFDISAEDFIKKILLGNLKAAHVVCGYNYTFGAHGRGSSTLIESICASACVGVTVIPEYKAGDITVSSSLIRELIEKGDVESASELLGRHYSICSTVTHGQHLARRLGFPTVNVIPAQGVILPKNGVYVTQTSFDSQKKYGITNIGIRPTVNTRILCAETHLFDYDGDLYGKKVTVEFLHFLRDEIKFESVDIMAEQIRKDIATAKSFVENF